MTADRGGPVGNVYDKYGTKNPVSRLLVQRFRGRINALILGASPSSLLDVGCGEGVVTDELARLLRGARVTGIDVPDPMLAAEWEQREAEYVSGSAYELPFDDDEFDLVSAIEVFEHLERPEAAVAEMARVTRRHVLVSVPRPWQHPRPYSALLPPRNHDARRYSRGRRAGLGALPVDHRARDGSLSGPAPAPRLTTIRP